MTVRVKQRVTKLPWRQIHFIGIGGMGMAGLALVNKKFGVQVTGSDKEESDNTHFLKGNGISITIGHSTVLPEKTDRIVYSSAIGEENPELQQAIKGHRKILLRGEFLAELADLYPQAVLIGGSHGKTTVAAMLSTILIDLGRSPTYLVGGGIEDKPFFAGKGNGELLVAEVDESDGSQSKIGGTLAMITNIDDDHFWSVGGLDNLMACFRKFAFSSDELLCLDTPVSRQLFRGHRNVDFFSASCVDHGLSLMVPGNHNRLNASLAIAAAKKLGCHEVEASKSLRKFTGVKRRLTVRFKNEKMVLLEDYAHHPLAVRESIKAIREMFPERRLIIVFQPHRYERVLHYSTQFAIELSRADLVFILPPFNAWINDENLCDPKIIVQKIKKTAAFYLEGSFPNVACHVGNAVREGDVLTVMGAGNIDAIIPILINLLRNGN